MYFPSTWGPKKRTNRALFNFCSHRVIPTKLKTNLVLRHEQKYTSLRIQVCPKKGFPLQSYSGDGIETIDPTNFREGSGFLGFENEKDCSWHYLFFPVSIVSTWGEADRKSPPPFGDHLHLGPFSACIFCDSGMSKKTREKNCLKVNSQSGRTEERWLTCSKNPEFFIH